MPKKRYLPAESIEKQQGQTVCAGFTLSLIRPAVS
jgi:hypothetical protein